MKKRFLTITMLTLISFTSCGTLANQNTISPSVDITPIPEVIISPSPSNSDSIIFPVMQAFKSVLLNEKTFYCTDKVPGYSPGALQQFNGYLNQVTYNNSSVEMSQFALVDLDGDDVPEIVVAMENYYGFVILRYKDGNVYGNIVSYRTMIQINKDGSFLSSSSSSDNSISKIFSIGDSFITDDKIASMDGSTSTAYYINDIPISKKTWDKQWNLFENSPDVEWHDYSKETINKWVSDNSFSTETLALSRTTIAERQNYLDSLSYLIDLTSSENTNQDEQNVAAKNYYNSCNGEMNKIYQMCKEKLSNDSIKTLNDNQLSWKENLDQEMSRFLSESQVNSMDERKEQSEYFFWGDIILRRTCYLINIYYDYQMYD